MGVQEEAVAATEVDGFSAFGGGDGGDGAGEIGVHGEFDIALALGDADERAGSSLKVGNELFGGFSPGVV